MSTDTNNGYEMRVVVMDVFFTQYKMRGVFKYVAQLTGIKQFKTRLC